MDKSVLKVGLARLLCIAGLAASGAASAMDPPRDPWSDAEWQGALQGLNPSAVRAVRWSEQLFAAQPGGEPVLVAQRISRLAFDDSGRLTVLATERQRRGERDERRQLRYHWGESAQLQRIDEEGQAQPLWQREVAGRVALETERRGAVLQRATIKLDAAGRELERLTDQGKPVSRVRERRTYHANGVLKSIESDTKGGLARTASFDPLGRPLKITERDPQGLRVTQIRYPTPLTAVYDDSGASLVRGALRKYSRELTFRVRHAEELQTAGQPLQPLSRREVRDGKVAEAQTEFDDEGRPMLERLLDGERVRCITVWQYHASGLPLSAHSRQPDVDARCPERPDLDVQIEVDAAGHWTRQITFLTSVDGRRVRTAEQTREIETR